jgi:hypothetical protein
MYFEDCKESTILVFNVCVSVYVASVFARHRAVCMCLCVCVCVFKVSWNDYKET